MPKLHIHEVAPRDGLQAESLFVPTRSKIRLIKLLAAAGPDSIEVTAFVRSDKVPALADADLLAEELSRVTLTGWPPLAGLVINLRGLERFLRTQFEIVTVPVSATEGHSRANAGQKVEEALKEACEVVRASVQEGRTARGVVSMAFGCPFDGAADPTVLSEIVHALCEAGAERVVFADTLGSANPEDVAKLFGSLSALVPVAQCGLHLHDNQGQASESVRLAWERGVRHFDSAAGGRGGCPFAPGAGGNLSTSVLVDVAETLGAECGIKSGSLREAEDFLAEALETRISGDA